MQVKERQSSLVSIRECSSNWRRFNMLRYQVSRVLNAGSAAIN